MRHTKGFPDGSMVKNPPAMQEPQETQVQFLGQEDPLEEGTATHSSILLPGESQGQGSLVGYSPWGHKESEATEHAHVHPGKCEVIPHYSFDLHL